MDASLADENMASIKEWREIEGYRIPLLTKIQIENLFGVVDERWQRVYTSPLTRMGVSDHQPVYPMTLNRLLEEQFQIKHWAAAAAHPMFEFPSRIKNFLVAITTIMQGTPKHVAVVGSKAMQGGAMWQEHFELFAARFRSIASITYFDTGEVDREYVVDCTKVKHISSWYNGDGAEYDCVIDDTFVGGDGPGKTRWKSQYWSQKDQRMEARPFFHGTEGRLFSHWQRSGKAKTVCACTICQHLAFVCPTYAEYAYIQKGLVSMGAPNCAKLPNIEDLKALFDMRRQLEVKATFVPKTGPQIRAAISEMHGGGVEPYGTHGIQRKVGAKPTEYVHKKGWKEPQPEYADTEWAGQSVALIGVSAEMFKGCNIVMKSGPYAWETHHFFSGDLNALHAVGSKYLWLREDLKIPPYEKTGRQFKGFTQYHRVHRQYDDKASMFSRLHGIEVPYADWMEQIPGVYKLDFDREGMHEPTEFSEDKKIYGEPFRVKRGTWDPLPLGLFPYMYDCTKESYVYSSEITDGKYYKVERLDKCAVQVSPADGCKFSEGHFLCPHYHILRTDKFERLLAPNENVGKKKNLLKILRSPEAGDCQAVIVEFFGNAGLKEYWETDKFRHKVRLKVFALYRDFHSPWLMSKIEARMEAYRQVYQHLRENLRV